MRIPAPIQPTIELVAWRFLNTIRDTLYYNQLHTQSQIQTILIPEPPESHHQLHSA
jgi:hypothetical protein